MKIIGVVALICTLATFSLVTSVAAQDLSSLLHQAEQSGDTMIGDIFAGLRTTNVSDARAEAQVAVTAGEQWQAILKEALALAPNDATRSAISGILDHVEAATNAAKLAVTGPDAEVQSRLDAARGETQEAITELTPLVARIAPATPNAPSLPATLPSAGGLDGSFLLLAGLSLLVIGFGLRRLRLAS